MAVLTLPAMVAAQDRDAALGRSHDRGGSPLAPSQARPANPGTAIINDDVVAQQSFERAVDDLKQGRGADGQRRLEWLIARYPDSAFADAARAKVVELYASPANTTATRSNLGVAPPGAPSARAREWRVEVLRAPTAGNDFRTAIGDRVFFASGSSELGSKARAALKAQAEWLQRHPSVTLTIEAHADDPGSAEDNRVLAERRAEAVRRRLVEEGVAASRIDVAAHGSERRLALCGEPVCNAQNRRAVSVLREQSIGTPAVAGTGPRAMAQPRVGLPR